MDRYAWMCRNFFMDFRNMGLYSKKTGNPQSIKYWKLDSPLDERAFRCAIDMFLNDDPEMENMRIGQKLSENDEWVVSISSLKTS